MQKNSTMQHILIGLTCVSVSLSGMNLPAPAVVHNILFKPTINISFPVTPENRPSLQEYFNSFGITLDEAVKCVVCVEEKKPIKKELVKDLPNHSNLCMRTTNVPLQGIAIPEILPMNIFIQNCAYISQQKTTTGTALHFRSAAAIQQNRFTQYNPNVHQNIQLPNNLRWLTTSQNLVKEQIPVEQITINIPIKIAHLLETTKNMADDLETNTENAFIPFPITDNMNEKAAHILFTFLDQCLLLINDSLEKGDCDVVKQTLTNDINNLSLEKSIQVLAAAHTLNLVKKYEEKEIILQPLLCANFLNKLKNTDYTTRTKIINSLVVDLQQELLYVFIEKEKLQEQLQKKYNALQKESATPCPDADTQIPLAFSYNSCAKKFNNSKLTLEKALLINDILTNKQLPNDLVITNETVTTPVRIILDACDNLQEQIILEKESAARRIALQKTQQEKAIERARQQEAAKIAEYNSLRARCGRFFTELQESKNPLILCVGMAVCVSFFSYYLPAITKYCFPPKIIISTNPHLQYFIEQALCKIKKT